MSDYAENDFDRFKNLGYQDFQRLFHLTEKYSNKQNPDAETSKSTIKSPEMMPHHLKTGHKISRYKKQ